MYPKIMVLSLSIFLLAGSLLHLRQSRLQEERAQAQLREHMLQVQHDIWKSDVRIAEHLKPGELIDQIETAQLELENATLTADQARERRAREVRTVQHYSRNR